MKPLRLLLGFSLLLLPLGALAAPAPQKADAGFEWSIEEGTQFNFDKLSIGLGEIDSGAYLDAVGGAQRVGLHANIDIAIDDEPSKFRQVDVHEGQILLDAGYRILIEKIIPGAKGTLILRVWGPHP